MTRARPLPPDERRAAIVSATKPLVMQYGASFSTRQVAEAAGIAEGTIFRVFDNKRSLLMAVIETLMDPSGLCDELDAIDRALPLEQRVQQMTALVQANITQISAMLSAVFSMPDQDGPLPHPPASNDTADPDHDVHRAKGEQLHAAMVRVIEPDADRLQCSAEDAASLIRSMAFATSHPHMSDGRITDPDRLSHLLLTGLLSSSETPCS